MGRKKRLVYSRNATRPPNVSALVDDLAPAVPDEERDRRRADGLDGGVQRHVVEGRPELRAPEIGVEPGEHGPLALLAGEELDDGHALERLLQERVQPGEPRAHHAVGVARTQAEVRGGQRQERHQGERHQRELPVHPEHDDDDAGEDEHVAHHRHHPAGEQLVDGLHVVHHARHEPPDGVPVEEARIELLEVAEEGVPEVAHHPLAGELGEIGLQRRAARTARRGRRGTRRPPGRGPSSRGAGCARRWPPSRDRAAGARARPSAGRPRARGRPAPRGGA